MACCGKKGSKNNKSFKEQIIDRRAILAASIAPKVILPAALELKKAENRKNFLARMNKSKMVTDPLALSQMNPRQRRIQRRTERIIVRNERMKLLRENIQKRQAEVLARNSFIIEKQQNLFSSNPSSQK